MQNRTDLEQQCTELNTKIASLDREIEAQTRQNASDRKQLEDLARMRDSLTKSVMTAGQEKEVKEALIKMHEATQKVTGTEEEEEEEER